MAKLVPVSAGERRVLGRDAGLFQLPEDFDAALPYRVLDDFYG